MLECAQLQKDIYIDVCGFKDKSLALFDNTLV